MADPNDPNVIDLSLGLADQASITAMDNLTRALSQNAAHFASLNAQTPGGLAQGQRAAASGLQGQPSPTASTPRPPRGDQRNIFQRARAMANPERELADYGQREREQFLYRSNRGYDNDPHWQSLRGANDQYSQNGSISTAPATSAGEPVWRQSLMANPNRWARSEEALQLPQFGQLTVQDKLHFASDLLARRANRQYERMGGSDITRHYEEGLSSEQEYLAQMAPITAATRRTGNAAGLLQIGAEQAGQVVAAGTEIRKAANAFQGVSERGTDLGFSRGNAITIPGTDIGFNNPASGAVKEGARQSLTSRRLGLQAGITMQKGREITDSLASYGWSGDEAQGLAFNGVAPLVQKGFNPQDVVSLMDQALRLGNTSLGDFVKNMGNLQDTSKTINLTLPETVAQLKEFVNFGTSHGATAQQAMTQGNQLSAANALAPGVNANLLNSPLVQGMASKQGFFPEQMGLMGANQSNKAIYDTLHLLEKSTTGYRQRGIKDPVTGKVMTGQQAQDAAIARLWGNGVDSDQIQKLRREEKPTLATGQGLDKLDVLDENIKAQQLYTSRNSRKGKGLTFTPENRRVTAAMGKQWDSVVNDLETLAPGRMGDKNNKERVKYFEKIRDLEKKQGRDRTAEARKLLTERRGALSGANADDKIKQEVLVEFTGDAKRFFKQFNSRTTSQDKRDAQYGGTPTNKKLLLRGPGQIEKLLYAPWDALGG